jgi:hypothetical protein
MHVPPRTLIRRLSPATRAYLTTLVKVPVRPCQACEFTSSVTSPFTSPVKSPVKSADSL